ncbi:MAG: hypothetical protein H7Y17_09580, partial [Chlorobia bacterium]|nr:hypothetical protein [Fimbriimonadaceae bacterium]
FFANVVAFVLYAQFDQRRFSRVLVTAAAVATCLALAVSGSRSALAGVAVVVLTAIIAVAIAKPKEITKFTKFFFVAGIAVLVASQFSVFDEGTAVMSQRIENASNTEGGFEGFILRFFGEFVSGYQAVAASELTGAGLGVGTNAGSALLSGKVTYLLAEGEWARMILEIGPFMGIIFILMRLGLAVWLFGRSLTAASSGKMLPVLLFGASGLTIVSGQWGQPTALGFAVLGGGLILAALRAVPEPQPDSKAGTS